MKKSLLSSVLAMALMVLPLGCMGDEEGEPVARVNGVPLLQSEFDQRVASLLIQNEITPEQAPAAARQQANRVVLDAMIAQALMYGAATIAGVVATEDEVELELSFARARYASRSEFESELEKRGLTEEEYRTNLSRELTIQKHIESNLVRELTVSDEDVRVYYDTHQVEFHRPASMQLRQIVASLPRGATAAERAAARAKAEQALEQVRAGQDFAAVARELSDDGTASQGGLIANLTEEELVPPLREAVKMLAVGDLSPVVESRFGFHLLRLEGRQEAQGLSFADAEEPIRQDLLAQRKRSAKEGWLQGLRAEARVEILSIDLLEGGTG